MKSVGDSPNKKRIIRVFLPFLMLLLGFFTYSFFNNIFDRTERAPVTSTTGLEVSAASSTKEIITTPITEMGTPSPTTFDSTFRIEETATPIPIKFTADDLKIKGPPSESAFTLDSPVTLYWTWPDNYIKKQHQFSVYLLGEFEEWLIGTRDEPSLGDFGYHINFTPGKIVESPGKYDIEIRLEQKEPHLIALRSNRVPVILNSISQ